jgi:hypothetical protein
MNLNGFHDTPADKPNINVQLYDSKASNKVSKIKVEEEEEKKNNPSPL